MAQILDFNTAFKKAKKQTEDLSFIKRAGLENAHNSAYQDFITETGTPDTDRIYNAYTIRIKDLLLTCMENDVPPDLNFISTQFVSKRTQDFQVLAVDYFQEYDPEHLFPSEPLVCAMLSSPARHKGTAEIDPDALEIIDTSNAILHAPATFHTEVPDEEDRFLHLYRIYSDLDQMLGETTEQTNLPTSETRFAEQLTDHITRLSLGKPYTKIERAIEDKTGRLQQHLANTPHIYTLGQP